MQALEEEEYQRRPKGNWTKKSHMCVSNGEHENTSQTTVASRWCECCEGWCPRTQAKIRGFLSQT